MSQQQGEKAENLRELLRQHGLHCRHLENERTGLLFAYIGSVASTTGLWYLTRLEWLLIISIFLTLVAFLLTRRWSQAFEMHEKSVDEIIGKLGYGSYGMDVPAGWFSKVFRTRVLFYLFYLFMFVALIIVVFLF